MIPKEIVIEFIKYQGDCRKIPETILVCTSCPIRRYCDSIEHLNRKERSFKKFTYILAYGIEHNILTEEVLFDIIL